MPFKSRQLLSQSPAKYHVFKDGTKYFCENRRTGKLPITDTDAYEVFQSLFTDYLSHGDRVFIENGEYSLSDEPNLLKQRCIIEGEGFKTRLIPATGKYALKIGNGVLDCGNNTIRDLQIEPSSLGDGSGIKADKANDLIIEHVQAKNCYTGFELKNSSRTRSHLIEALVFTNAGILYPTGAGVITDQYLNNIYVESNQPASIGIKVEESVNGIRISDALIAGALKTGLAYGIDFVGSHCGIWLNNVIIDQIYGTGIRLKNGVSHGCAGIQAVNVWAQSCGGHGLHIEGSSGYKIIDGLFSNCGFNGNDKTGIKMQNAEWMSFENCRVMNNAQDNLADDIEMTNLLLLDVISTTDFSNVWFGWMDGWNPANRQKPVLVRAENGGATIAKFQNCKVRDPNGNAFTRIEYYQHTDASVVYLYGYECITNNFAEAPDDTLFVQDVTGDPATVCEENDNHIGKAFGW